MCPSSWSTKSLVWIGLLKMSWPPEIGIEPMVRQWGRCRQCDDNEVECGDLGVGSLKLSG